MNMEVYQKIVNHLGIKIANLEVQNASLLAELEELRATLEDQEENNSVTKK